MITLADIRALNSDYFDEETGVRYTTDSMGNQIMITPTEVIDSPDRPEQPLAIPEEEARGYRYEGSIRDPKTMTFRDAAGNIVTMSETDIAPYLFDPTLAQREADLARVSADPGQTLEGGVVYQDPYDREGKIREGDEDLPYTVAHAPEPGPVPKTVEEASRRIQERAGMAPPGREPTAGAGPVDFLNPESRNQFEEFIFNKMGGDPRGLNPHLEVQKLVDEDTAQQLYIQNWQEGMKTWFDLTDREKSQLMENIRTELLPEVQAEIAAKQQSYKIAMERFDRTQKAYKDRFKTIQAEEKRKISALKQEREQTSRMRRNMATNLKRISDNTKAIEELKATESPGWENQVSNLESANKQLQADIDAAKKHLGIKGKKGDRGDKAEPGADVDTDADAAVAEAETEPQAQERPASVPNDATRWVTYENDVTAADGSTIPAGTYFEMPDGNTYRAKGE